MTVKELIEKLSDYREDAQVVVSEPGEVRNTRFIITEVDDSSTDSLLQDHDFHVIICVEKE